MSRFRFGHKLFNDNLFQIGKRFNGKWDFCNDDETIEHVLKCRMLSVQRRLMKEHLEGKE